MPDHWPPPLTSKEEFDDASTHSRRPSSTSLSKTDIEKLEAQREKPNKLPQLRPKGVLVKSDREKKERQISELRARIERNRGRAREDFRRSL